jgi:hypothetical protein
VLKGTMCNKNNQWTIFFCSCGFLVFHRLSHCQTIKLKQLLSGLIVVHLSVFPWDHHWGLGISSSLPSRLFIPPLKAP